MRPPQSGRQFNRCHGRHDVPVIIIIREDLQQYGGGRPEEEMRIRGGHRHVEDQRDVNGKAITKRTWSSSAAEWQALVFAKLGLLLDLIQIMYQNRSDSPFQTHPATMVISLAALCISCFAAAALANSKVVKMVEEEEEQQQQRTTGHFLYFHRILDLLVLISGVVTLSCLVSIFVPNGVVRIMCISCASTISALVVGRHVVSLPIFGRPKSSHGKVGLSGV